MYKTLQAQRYRGASTVTALAGATSIHCAYVLNARATKCVCALLDQKFVHTGQSPVQTIEHGPNQAELAAYWQEIGVGMHHHCNTT